MSGNVDYPAAFVALAEGWIARSVDQPALGWFRKIFAEIRDGAGERELGLAISLAPRRLGRSQLGLDAADLAQADAVRSGFSPINWSIDQLGRVALMAASHHDDSAFAAMLDHLCASAELNELIALCLGFAVYPVIAPIEPRAREAIRSGIKPVFEAIAHHNPYPSEAFAEDDWNQMVVKAVFNGSALWPIQGLDRRGNANLARMLVALAHERQAAGRPISPEIWRCVVPHADADGMATMAAAWRRGDDRDRLAIALAARSVPERTEAMSFAPELTSIEAVIASRGIIWRDLASAE